MNQQMHTDIDCDRFETTLDVSCRPCETKSPVERGSPLSIIPGMGHMKGNADQRDVVALHRMMGEEIGLLFRAKEIAEALVQAKDRCLAIVSHELRTPLTPIAGAVDMLMDDPDISAENMMLLEMVRENVVIEMQLINDLLEMTRLSNGKIVLEMKPIDAHVIVRKAVLVCASDCERKNLSVTADLSASDTIINGDPIRLEQVFWNLLKNSAKFTPERGCIHIRTWNDESGHLLIEVSDTGIGIEKQALQVIFNAFEQGDRAIAQNFGGLGLGLAISRMLVEMLGGRIYASSEGRGRGAAFTVELDAMPLPGTLSTEYSMP